MLRRDYESLVGLQTSILRLSSSHTHASHHYLFFAGPAPQEPTVEYCQAASKQLLQREAGRKPDPDPARVVHDHRSYFQQL
jgi:hypothetical protein